MKISVIIVSLNGRPRIDMPMRALSACDPAPHEVIVVDNGSSDGLSAHVRAAWPGAVLVRAARNLGFAGGNNLGMMNATGDVHLLLNDDTEPEPRWLAPIADALAADPRLGIVGCQLIYPNSTKVQHLGGIVHRNGLTDHVGWGSDASQTDESALIACDYATGAAMAIRRDVVREVGMLDPGFWPIYFEEVDFCERARRAGWKVAVAPASRVVHHESQTTGRLSRGFLEKYHRNRIRYLVRNRTLRQWPGTLRAEARWIVDNRPWDALWACACAWAWSPFQLADLMRAKLRGERI